ncbi:(d)CMP kinase [Cloacibacillus sp. An23]|uniref:(d)CMP kinase n=1 Tax=Cloacibacillus sp. An23 TaxID=1965591 RepID=UPI000B57B7DB|nr:(d)CMP kinase [Cloacibacillus sp. An23]OUO93047.1 cytidylate kinase [Cloacibacillus sp. An23]
MSKRIIVTIDGPAGAGKSTTAKAVAEKTGLPYLDTGALYRAVAWKLDRDGIAPEDGEKISEALKNFKIDISGGKVSADGEDVTEAIRTAHIDEIVSAYAARPEVRGALAGFQRAQAADGLVADGRDMGTVVFPEAQLKIFLTASAEERARRRCAEREAKGESADYEEILKQVIERDRFDMTREIAPLRPAQGCVILDSTTMSAAEVVDAIASLAKEIEAQENR